MKRKISEKEYFKNKLTILAVVNFRLKTYRTRQRDEESAGNSAPVRPRSRRIDYIFTSGQVKVLNYGVITDFYGECRFPSDHFPVVSQVVIE